MHVWKTPSYKIASSIFLACETSSTGGGLYNNNYGTAPITIKNSLFKGNTALYSNTGSSGIRGGGALEDYGTGSYESHYLFSFFNQNRAPNCVGHDIAKPNRSLPEENVIQCFTTTSAGALWSGGKYANWLP